jgi:hypothetical protein
VIDPGIQQPWPDAVREAVTHFRQGDLIERPPLFYAANGAHAVWALTRESGSSTGGIEILELDSADVPPYGIITTQTCDVVEETPKPKQPWIQVAPVYDAGSHLSYDQQKLIMQDRVVHLVHLTGSALQSGFWVADLRIELPLEKSLLVGQSAVPGFSDEVGYQKLARRLAGRRSRPAFAPEIGSTITGPLKQQLDALSKSKRADLLDPVMELRVAVDGTCMNPRAIGLIIVVKEGIATHKTEVFFNDWWTQAGVLSSQANLVLLANRFTTLRAMSALDYVDSFPLDFSYLSPDE